MTNLITLKHGALLRQFCIVALSATLVWFFCAPLFSLDFAGIWAEMRSAPPHLWLLGGALSAISFAAVAQYDVAVGRHLGLPFASKTCRSAGWRATAIAQTLGFGLFSGALVRWYVLNGGLRSAADNKSAISLWQATQMTLGVTLSFFFGWLVITSALTLSMSGYHWSIPLCGALGLAIAFAISISGFFLRGTIARILPSLRSCIRMVVLTLIDTVAAASIIFIFLPDGYISFQMLYLVFMLSMAAGMISGLPGGVGPFELTFLALAGTTDPAPLAIALMAYRSLYFGAPAVLAAIKLLPRLLPPVSIKPAHRGNSLQHLRGIPPEADLCTQGLLQMETNPETGIGFLKHQTTNSTIILGDLFGAPNIQAEIVAQLDDARRSDKAFCLYKATTASLPAAKSLGLQAHRIGTEALLNPKTFNLDGRSKRGLRRKLRTCEKAGITTRQIPPQYSMLSTVDAEWCKRQGGARGFSMGQLCPDLIARQHIFGAFLDDQLVAFVSFSTGDKKWSLDLVRSLDDCPDGTLYALIMEAISSAGRADIETLSLAAVPMSGIDAPNTWVEMIAARLFKRSAKNKGLYQFKASFDPVWQPLYFVTRNARDAICCGFDLWRLIENPPVPIAFRNQPHEDYDNYEFVSQLMPCKTATSHARAMR